MGKEARTEVQKPMERSRETGHHEDQAQVEANARQETQRNPGELLKMREKHRQNRYGTNRKKWIQKAIPKKRRCRLRKYIRREYGSASFESGAKGRLRIKSSVLRSVAEKSGSIAKAARLAKTLRGLRK
ncbi:MAG: hypothetical protein ABSB28_11970 [Candidatus Bathyarchaeia archaeon]